MSLWGSASDRDITPLIETVDKILTNYNSNRRYTLVVNQPASLTMSKFCKPCASIYMMFCIVANIMVFLVLGIALYLRLSFFAPISRLDMPTDSRVVVHDPTSSVFCKEHDVMLYLVKPHKNGFIFTQNVPSFSQTRLKFNALVLEYEQMEAIAKRPLIQQNITDLKGYNALKPGQYIFHPFHVRSRSTLDAGICFEYCNSIHGHNEATCADIDKNAIFALYVIEGEDNIQELGSAIEQSTDNYRAPNCTGSGHCTKYEYSAPGINCPSDPTIKNMPHHMTRKALSDSDIYFVYYFPSNTQPMTPIKFRMYYNITNFIYNISGFENRVKREVDTINTQGNRPIDLEFASYGVAPDSSLYAIQVDYSCSPDILVYLGVFFLMPIGVLIIIFLLLKCCCTIHADDKYLVNRRGTTSYESITDYSA